MIYIMANHSIGKSRPSLRDLEYLRINPGVETPGYCHSSLCDDQMLVRPKKKMINAPQRPIIPELSREIGTAKDSISRRHT